ncbi:MAG: rhodanese-like domain-containing protein [Desulfobacterales bacterium]|jgi:Fe-Mn family superoxide dismutase|nr:rhodanese-like domain-containing protein [Desulfobacteraceae bacterium]MDY0312569.1 rhodanese-like domain-containing protein [Desulfobacterales bacterium]
MKNEIDVLTLAEQVKTVPEGAIYDVRMRADLLANPQRIPGAQWRDPEQVDRWAAEFSKGQAVVVYDLTGGPVSRTVAEHLRQKGIEARHLTGGLATWLAWAASQPRQG